MVKELLKESEIKVNQAQTTDGRTALYIASIKGFLEVVQVLLVGSGAGSSCAPRHQCQSGQD